MNDTPETHESAFQAAGRSSFGIGLFAVLAAGVIAVTQFATVAQIVQNVRAAQSRALFEIYPKTIDPELFNHKIALSTAELGLGQQTDQSGYQVIKAGQVSGVILPVRTSQGYSGDIDLLVGINQNGSIQGVRVVSHRETPGLGDNVERSKSDWILGFEGKRRQGTGDPNWAVRKDGGQFDQFTGATITPRAVVSATARALDYFDTHPELLKPAVPMVAEEN